MIILPPLKISGENPVHVVIDYDPYQQHENKYTMSKHSL